MAVLARFACCVSWTTLALFAVACGRTSLSPTSPSSTGGRGVSSTRGAVIIGTVSGTAAATLSSSVFSPTVVTKPVTVTVVGTNISTTIDGSGRFQLTGVPAGDVRLRFTATGLDATLTLRSVQTGDRIDLKVRLTDTSVRIVAERRSRDDDGDDDEDDDDRDDDELEGTVSGLTGTCPSITFTLNRATVKADASTRYEDGTCAQIRNNLRLEVHGRRLTDGSVQAIVIELED
jgi:hypothetical protein